MAEVVNLLFGGCLSFTTIKICFDSKKRKGYFFSHLGPLPFSGPQFPAALSSHGSSLSAVSLPSPFPFVCKYADLAFVLKKRILWPPVTPAPALCLSSPCSIVLYMRRYVYSLDSVLRPWLEVRQFTFFFA